MKYKYLLLLVLIPLFGFGQNNEVGFIDFDTNDYNFYEIYSDGGVVEYDFSFLNSGNAPLVINNVRSNSENTKAEWVENPVLPGKTAYINIKFDPKNYLGVFHKTFQVQSTASNSNMFITIHGKVIEEEHEKNLEFKFGDLLVQSKHINMGFINKGQLAKKNIDVKNSSSLPITVTFENVPEYIEAFIRPNILNPGEIGKIEILLHSDRTDEWDVIFKKLDVIINGAKISQRELILSANIREDFSQLTADSLAKAPVAFFSESTYDFDTLGQDKIINCSFQLSNTGKGILYIRAVIPSCGCTVVKPQTTCLKRGESTSIEAFFNPNGNVGNNNKAITVITNDPKNSKQFLWIKGYILP